MAVPQHPPRAARSQTTLPAAEETRDAESFRAWRFAKGRSQVKEPGCEGVAGAAPGWAATARCPDPDGPPPSKGSEVSPSRAWGLQIQREPGPSGKGREGNLSPCRNGMTPPPDTPSLPARARGCWVCFIHFLNWRKGAHRLPLAHSGSQ